MDCVVTGVAKRRTRLSDFHFHVQSEVKKYDSLSSVLSQDCFGYLEFVSIQILKLLILVL